MQKILPMFKYAFLAFIIALNVSCSAEDGADGMDGVDGLQGPPGPAGQDGVDGNSNVTTVILEDVSLQLGLNEISVPQLTQDIFDEGLVYVYITQEAGVWFTLPFTEESNVGTEEEPVLVSLVLVKMIGKEVGKVLVSSFIEGDADLKFVFIEGNVDQLNSVDMKDFM